MSSDKERVVFSVQVCIEEDGDEFYAHCPQLSGLHTAGATKDEAFENAKDAISAYLQSLMLRNDPIPQEIVGPHRPSLSERIKSVACPSSVFEDLVEISL